MGDLIHWDYAEEFSGRDAAYLIGGFDPSLNNAENLYKVQPIIRRLKKAYYECAKDFSSVAESGYDDGAYMGELIREGFNGNPAMYRFMEYHLESSTKLLSIEIEEIFNNFKNSDHARAGYAIPHYYKSQFRIDLSAEEIKAGKEEGNAYWTSLWAAYAPAYEWSKDFMHEFDDQRFSRSELRRWIMLNKFPTHYQFTEINGDMQMDKPLSRTERTTLLSIIAALCKDAGHDYTKHAKTAGAIKRTAETMGLSIGESTIEGKLKLIADALETRIK